ncbi:OLC1v1027386C1 [Oldenlandia corymbosa var. corymbosa]|uniref:OLC1v1027386C1 n=1 Tax=Oldenlandia corymbosa var. corymbosa TaxID=529605 RepID=A0AAV1C9D8_OLDCO|nr:OLC1v1027386C1 [Oldenlandia corymbosa var. corymbosa]
MEDKIIRTGLYPCTTTSLIGAAENHQNSDHHHHPDSHSLIGYKPQLFPPIIISITSYEWEMKNLSSQYSGILPNPPQQNRQPSESRLEERGRSHEEEQNDDDDDEEDEAEDNQQEDKARCEWDFSLSTVVSSGAISDTLGVIEIDPSDRLLATGGISRKIRIYNSASLLPSFEHPESSTPTQLLDHATACDFYICTPAKLSSLRWKPGSAGTVLGSADYDGVVTEYDLEKRLPVFERDEHGGRRVWSMDYSPGNSVVGASGSDDGTMQMWDPRCDGGECLAAVQPSAAKSPVCCVEFNPYRGEMVAVGCADSRIYGYDVRRMAGPVAVLDGHRKAVTYIRFIDHDTMVTSGIDGSLKMWHAGDRRVVRSYTGHVNTRRFVGLSAWRGGGLLSCGSEDNRVFVYDTRWGEPIWAGRFEPAQGPAGWENDRGFVSSVCWRQLGEDHCTLVAGGSDGALQIFSGRRRL